MHKDADTGLCAPAFARVRVRVCMFICVRLQGLAGVSSTSPPGGNQVDGLPPAPVRSHGAEPAGASLAVKSLEFSISFLSMAFTRN